MNVTQTRRQCCYLPSTLVVTNAWCDVPPVLFSLGIIFRASKKVVRSLSCRRKSFHRNFPH